MSEKPKFGEESVVDKCHWVWKKILLSLSRLLLSLSPTYTHTGAQKQSSNILEAPVRRQVYFGVGGDRSSRLHPPSSPQNVSHLTSTANPLAGRRVEIFLLLLKCLDKDLLSASLQLLLGLI